MNISRTLIFLILFAGLLLSGCGARVEQSEKANFVVTECVEMAELASQPFGASFFINPLYFIGPLGTPSIVIELVDADGDGAVELQVPFSFDQPVGFTPMLMFLTNSPNGGFKQVLVRLDLGALPAEIRGFDSSGTLIASDIVNDAQAELALNGNGKIISFVEFHMTEALIKRICW